ncbi:hypothetical protein LOZ80_15260 [Paenibacillus sp. HWE-109]|uniref:hypothetical protein n=1 Tax=Paenibacillus sp. HWE-109 TaxID=1306526 RepID=UPI001EE10190|nr:hypothetical protein [Paenibacillus sp. HWE-109]UKS30218.1 hypothetical protein LOZ80_15260 [Paenibacillus sp. HWE-109]
MAANKTIRKAVCDKCGHTTNSWNARRKHGYYEGDCGGTFIATDVPKEVIMGEFVFERSSGNRVYLKHVESGRSVNIFTVDLLKVLAGRPIGALVLTESKRGDQTCWKAQEVNGE